MALIFYPYSITQTDRTTHTRVTEWRVPFSRTHSKRDGRRDGLLARLNRWLAAIPARPETRVERAINEYGCAIIWLIASIALVAAVAAL